MFKKAAGEENGKHLRKYICVILAVELYKVGARPEPIRLNKIRIELIYKQDLVNKLLE